MGREFADSSDPLLVSVRSGAKFSMPGMMDTILNLGLNDESVNSLAERAGERFAWDAYRRLIQMYGHVVLDVDSLQFENIIEEIIVALLMFHFTAKLVNKNPRKNNYRDRTPSGWSGS